MTILRQKTTVVMTAYLSIYSTLESRYLVLSSLHIGLHNGDTKYSIYLIKRETTTNITIHKMTEIIESNNILEDTDDEGEIHVLLYFKYTVMVVQPVSPIKNIPHSMRVVFFETIIRYYQHKTEAAPYYYF